MIGRLLFYSALLMLATTVAGIQLDRQTQRDPRFAALVPPPLRAISQRILVETLAQGGGGVASVAQARTLIRRRPVPAHHLTLFALSAQYDGEQQRAIPALEEAARRGWREPIAQVAVARAALLSRDYNSAAQRVAALLATGSMPEATDALLTTLVATDEGQAALESLMEQPGYWQAQLLRRLSATRAPAAVIERLAQAQQRAASRNRV